MPSPSVLSHCHLSQRERLLRRCLQHQLNRKLPTAWSSTLSALIDALAPPLGELLSAAKLRGHAINGERTRESMMLTKRRAASFLPVTTNLANFENYDVISIGIELRQCGGLAGSWRTSNFATKSTASGGSRKAAARSPCGSLWSGVSAQPEETAFPRWLCLRHRRPTGRCGAGSAGRRLRSWPRSGRRW